MPSSSAVFLRVMICVGLMLCVNKCVHADEKTGSVQGMVTFKGKPVPDGKVTFYLDNGQFVGSKIKNGEYKVEHVPVGVKRVTIEGAGIPAKYASEDVSGLSFESKARDNNFDISLTP
jgi:hypothetical protein